MNGRLRINQQRRNIRIKAGKRNISIHPETLYLSDKRHHSNVAKRMGDSCT